MPAWSFSSLTAFETCPRRYYLVRVAKKITEPPTEATTWGNEVHKALELRIGEGKPLPDVLVKYEPIATRVLSLEGDVYVERQIALDSAFRQTEWYGKDAWVRSILDLTVINGRKALILDWKTGKRKPDSSQLALFAAVGFAVFPDVEEIHTGFVWLKENATDKTRYRREDTAALWGEFLPRVRRLELAYEKGAWPAKPSGLCRKYCPVGRSNCEFCGK